MSSAAGRRKPSLSASASTVFADNAAGYHDLKIDSYSRIKGIPAGVPIFSSCFSVSGHPWRFGFFPNGERTAEGIIGFGLILEEDVAKPLTAQFEFAFMGEERGSFFRNRKRTEQKLRSLPAVIRSFADRKYQVCPVLLNRKTLEKYVSKDSLTVRCNIVVFDDMFVATRDTFVSVPPSNLHLNFGDLLASNEGADVTFLVAGETFKAHRCVLAARSPVFKAEVFGRMKESTRGAVIRVDDMDAQVFKALLDFVYTDALPDFEDGMKKQEEAALAQHLLVAADRYNLERLKLICEDRLCGHIDTASAATILALAEQHHCCGLKEACFRFLSTSIDSECCNDN